MKIIKDIDLAVKAFIEGKIGVFPTDTVWGVGCVLKDEKAIRRLYEIKKRESGKPTAVLVADFCQASELGEFNLGAKKLAEKYWPGALTIVLPIKGNMSFLILGRAKNIGLRVPDNELILRILKRTGSLVATSANFVNEPAPVNRVDIERNFLEKVDFLIEGEDPQEKQASTVVDVTVTPFRILRQGTVIL